MRHININQEKVLEDIRTAAVKEELAVPLYVSHIKEVFFWSGLSAKVRDEIVRGLQVLEKDSRGHIELLKEVERIYKNLIK